LLAKSRPNARGDRRITDREIARLQMKELKKREKIQCTRRPFET
jgi:hypothetical protein